MAGVARMKRVTDPLDDKVKDRIVGLDRREPVYVSSGSHHSGGNDDESPCLSVLLNGFLEDDAGSQSPENESDSEHRDQFVLDQADKIDDLVKSTVLDISVDSFRNVLVVHVSKAMAVYSCLRSNKSVLRRNVMAFLRNLGYNAAICKTKWESSGGLTSGNYEFIDVVRSESATRQTRYFVDLDFAGEFEIARPTEQYERLLRRLPRVFIGRGEDLKRIVKVSSEAAKRSLKSGGLYLPPWRKNRFMQNKWFGTYRRTVNLAPAKPSFAVECRSVGFDAVDGRSFLPAATRTR